MPATFTVFKTWNAGDILTAADLNSSYTQFINNLDPSGLGSASSTIAAMRNVSNPYPSGVEAPASSLLLELQQIRYQFTQITGNPYWYQSPGWSGAFITPSAGSLAVRQSHGDLVDRNSNLLFAAGVPNANNTGSTTTTTISGIAVTNGDILVVQAYVTYTSGGAGTDGYIINPVGVTYSTLANSLQPGDRYKVDNAAVYNKNVFSVILVLQTGTLSLSGVLTATSPTGISNYIGYGFLKKQ